MIKGQRSKINIPNLKFHFKIEAEESYAMNQLHIVDDLEYYEKMPCCVKKQKHDIKYSYPTVFIYRSLPYSPS